MKEINVETQATTSNGSTQSQAVAIAFLWLFSLAVAAFVLFIGKYAIGYNFQALRILGWLTVAAGVGCVALTSIAAVEALYGRVRDRDWDYERYRTRIISLTVPLGFFGFASGCGTWLLYFICCRD
jgi:hypothetical protein